MRIAIGAELAELHRRLAVLCPARKAIVIELESAVFDVEVRRAVVITYACRIGHSVAAIAKNYAGNGIIFRAAELPCPARLIACGVTAGRIIEEIRREIRAEIPHRRVGGIERMNADSVRGGFGEIDAKGVGAGRNDHFRVASQNDCRHRN